MKKLLGLALLITTLHADSSADPTQLMEPVPMDQPVEEFGSSYLTEIKMGYFRFGDKKLRHTYEDGLLDLQLTSSFCVWKPLYIYAGVEYIGDDGRTPREHEKIKIRMVPVSLGLQYIQPITVDFKYYLTLGPRYFFVHQWNRSSSLTHSGVGGFANTGFMYYLSQHIVVDFFGEYSWKTLRFHDMGGTLQVGGLTLGAGIGYFW